MVDLLATVAIAIPRHSKLTPPWIRSHIASGLSTKFMFVKRRTTTVRPSGTAPIGGTMKRDSWVYIAIIVTTSKIRPMTRDVFIVRRVCGLTSEVTGARPGCSRKRRHVPARPVTAGLCLMPRNDAHAAKLVGDKKTDEMIVGTVIFQKARLPELRDRCIAQGPVHRQAIDEDALPVF
jgi:hypothetical protein